MREYAEVSKVCGRSNTVRFILPILFLFGCERAHQPSQPTPSSFARVYLFAAGYCAPCKEELVEIRDWHASLPKERRDRIEVMVYLVAGDTPGSKVDQVYADRFGGFLNLSFIMRPDKFGKLYKSYYDAGLSVPATVILNKEWVVTKIFSPGRISAWQLSAALLRLERRCYTEWK